MSHKTSMDRQFSLPGESPEQVQLLDLYAQYVLEGGLPPAHYLGEPEDVPELAFDRDQLCCVLEQLIGEAIERGEL